MKTRPRKKNMPSGKVAVLGAGMWGTVLAQRLAEKGHPIALWEFFPDLASTLQTTRRHPQFPGMRLHQKIQVSPLLEDCVPKARLILMARPSQHVRHPTREEEVERRNPIRQIKLRIAVEVQEVDVGGVRERAVTAGELNGTTPEKQRVEKTDGI